MSGSAAAAQDANALLNELHSSGQWTFESVATTLQELVTEHDLMGVAAANLFGADPTLFLFDGAEAVTSTGTIGSEGRAAWVTEVLDGDSVELRLTESRAMPPLHGTELRDGVVGGAGALVALSAPRTRTPQTTASQPAPPWPGATVDYQPPPPANAPPAPPPNVVSPPPHQRAGLGRPTRVPAPAPPPPTPEQPRPRPGT